MDPLQAEGLIVGEANVTAGEISHNTNAHSVVNIPALMLVSFLAIKTNKQTPLRLLELRG